MRYTTILFDMDGTIIETEHIWKQATRELIICKGLSLTDAELDNIEYRLHGLSIDTCCQLIKEICRLPDSVESLIQQKAARAYNLYATGIRFINGFVEFHKVLQNKGLKSAIATNASKEIVTITDKKLNLKQFFGNHVYHMEHVNHKSKPDPAIFLHAAEQLISQPQDCIVIEDSPPGIRAAKNAGMYCIAINTSKQKEKLREADLIIEGYHELDLKNFK